MNLFDSHCHLDLDPLCNEIGPAVERAYKANVLSMVNVGATISHSEKAVEIANLYPNIWASVGVHPHDAEANLKIDELIEKLNLLTKNDKVVAIGEIGLDYFYLEDKELKKTQKDLFVAQLELAIELNLPIIFHVRDAWDDFFEIISKYPNSKGVMHCFTGDEKIVKKLLKLDLYIGFTGFVTFDQEKFNHIRESAKIVPIDKLLIETDAPYLAPEPYRGKTNEPAYIIEVAKKIAELKSMTIDEVAKETDKNAKKLFNIS